MSLGNTTPTRDLTFVHDTVEGFINISKTDKLNGEVTNIGNGTEISIKELALKLPVFAMSRLNCEFHLNVNARY